MLQSGASVVTLLNEGDGTFGGQETYTIGPVSDDAVQFVWTLVEDFDGDGLKDLLAVERAQAGERYSLVFRPATGTPELFGEPVFNGTIPFARFFVAADISDFEGPGHLDVVYSTDGVTLQALLGRGDGTFERAEVPVITDPPRVQIDSVQLIADATGDGHPDLIGTRVFFGPPGILIFPSDGVGGFGEAQVVDMPGTREYGPLIYQDMNGDNRRDLVFLATGIFPPARQLSSQIVVLPGGEDGFGEPTTFPPVSFTGYVVGDIDADGHRDIIMSGFRPTEGTGEGIPGVVYESGLAIYKNSGQGGFTSTPVFADRVLRPHNERKLQQDIPFTYVVAAADFDNDGLTDVVHLPKPGSVALMLGQPDGTLAEASHYLLDGGIRARTEVLDVDNDGDIDILRLGEDGISFTLNKLITDSAAETLE